MASITNMASVSTWESLKTLETLNVSASQKLDIKELFDDQSSVTLVPLGQSFTGLSQIHSYLKAKMLVNDLSKGETVLTNKQTLS